MSIETRITNLERKFNTEPLVLTMADGIEQRIPLGRGDVLGFMQRALCDPAGPDAGLIRASVSAIEPGGSLLVELTRAILTSPVDQ